MPHQGFDLIPPPRLRSYLQAFPKQETHMSQTADFTPTGLTSDPSQYDEATEETPSAGINVGSTERNISMAVGVALGVAGLAKPLTLRGLVEIGLGVALIHRGMTGHCKLYDAIGVSTADTSGEPSAQPEEYFRRSIHVQHQVTILKPASELYNFWRRLENLPRFMEHLKDVKQTGATTSHWVAKGPLNSSIEWDAEIINEEADRLIAWRSTGDAEVDNSGSVRFVDAGDKGTEVQVTLDYIPPAGKVGAMVAKLFGEEPDQTVKEDLRRFKALMEAGELPTTDGQPRGNCKGGGTFQDSVKA
jgi:uncharacterized membrane protein